MKKSKNTESYFEEVTATYKDVNLRSSIGVDLRERGKDEMKATDECAVIRVLDVDSFEAAKLLKSKYGPDIMPLVLNMASDKTPGGGWRKGSMAQEEALFYRSTYALSLESSEYYPLSTYQGVYTNNVCVFLDTNMKPLPWKSCYLVSCLAVAALRRPPTTSESDYKVEMHRDIMRTKIEGIFTTAIKYEHEYLVLGALGCGAFRNPVKAVAALYREMVDKYKSHFKEIIFAVLRRKDSDEINFQTFKALFGSVWSRR